MLNRPKYPASFDEEYNNKSYVSDVDWERIGKHIRQFRELRGLTQIELSEKIGYKKTAITRLENNFSNISLEGFLLICDALQVSPDVLLLGNYDIQNSSYYPRYLKLKDSIEEQLQNCIHRILDSTSNT